MSLNHNRSDARENIVSGSLHKLLATPKTVHWGYFDSSLAPVLTGESGDIIQAEAITHHAGDDPDLMIDVGIGPIFDKIPPEDRSPGEHIMTSPLDAQHATP